jgi:hypothetical protein
MEFVKKNIISLSCGVVALVALVYYLVGVQPKYSSLEKEMAALTNKPTEMLRIVSTPRMLPVVTEGDQKVLPVFPTEPVITKGQNLITQLKTEANNMVAAAVNLNHGTTTANGRAARSLLVDRILPNPDPPTLAFVFRKEYNEKLRRGGAPADGTKNLPDMLQSVEPPTEYEIAKAKKDKWDKEFAPQIEMRDGLPFNKKEVDADYLREIEGFDERFRRERAAKYKLYLDPAALMIAPTMVITAGKEAPTVENIWFAQVSLWLQQDVGRAVAALNQPARNIPEAPIKHLISVDIRQDFSMYVLKGGGTGAPVVPQPDAAGGTPVASAPVVEIDVKDYALSPTGRVCNRLYDVVQFYVVAVVDAKAVKPFIQQLQFGQFINVLEVDVQGVDLDQSLEDGYEYGKRPVVEVKLRCEALFLRDWTAWVPPPETKPGQTPGKWIQGPMPLKVQQMLGIPNPAAKPVQPQESAG